MLSSYRLPQKVIRQLMMYMVFARGLCRNKHVKLSSPNVSILQLLKQPCTVLEFPSKKKQKQRAIVRHYSVSSTLLFLSTGPRNINKLIMYYQQEKLINNSFLGNLMGSLWNKACLFCFFSCFKSWDFFCILLSTGQEKAIALATMKLTRTIRSPGSLAWCFKLDPAFF